MTDQTTADAGEMPGDAPTSTEIARVTQQHAVEVMPLMTDAEIHSTWRIAKALAVSRMFKDAAATEQAFAKILIGRDLGISPTQSLMAIDLVKGAIQLRGVLLASFVRKHPDYDFKVLEKTHEKSRVLFLGYPQDEPEEGLVRRGGKWWEVLGEEEFTIEDATRAKLIKNDGAWQAHPKNMCFWRCISNGVKTYAPELLGGMPVYVEGELAPAALPVASAAAAASPPAPTELVALVQRAAGIDPQMWRMPEINARLPYPSDPAYQAAVDQIVAEITDWLDEHEPKDATVVSEAAPVVSSEGQGEAPTVEAAVTEEKTPQERWDSEPEWRAQADPLLHRYADMEAALDEAVSNNDEDTAEGFRERLREIEGDMDALGVPAGWWPAGADDDVEPS